MALGDHVADRQPTRVRWQVFALAFGTSFLLYLHRYTFAFIKPILQKEWELTNTELGDLDSGFAICYSVFQFPLAVVADWLGVHIMLGGLMGVWCGGLAFLALATSTSWLWWGLALLGTGQSAVYACLNRVARNWFPYRIRTTLQGAVGILAGRLGALGSSVFFTTFLLGICQFDWRTAVWILTAIGVAHLMWFVVAFRNQPQSHPGVNDAERQLIREGEPGLVTPTATQAAKGASQHSRWRSLSPAGVWNLAMLSLQTLLSTFADNIYSNWIPQFLSQVHDLEYKRMGIFAALPLLGGALAGVVGGWLNDACIARTGNRRWSRVGVALTGKGLAACWMGIALLFYDRPYVFCALLFLVKFFGDWSLATAWGVVTDIGGPITASVFAFSNSVAGIALIVAPRVIGRVADMYGWRMVFIMVAATYAACAASWLWINCTVPLLARTESSASA